MVKYLQHTEHGGIHSVTDADFEENYLLNGHGQKGAGLAGKKTLDPSWKEITEDEARALNPQLFGENDPAVDAGKDR